MKKIFVAATVLAIALVSSVAMAGIVTSKHNLSASGTAGAYTSNSSEICIFCHTPHNANKTVGPLWNRTGNQATSYTMYSLMAWSGANPNQADLSAASRGCLSCHDGATSLNSLVNTAGATITMSGGKDKLSSGNANLGTDLSNDHPVAALYETAGNSLRALTAGTGYVSTKVTDSKTVKGEAGVSKVNCESCHDVHSNNAKFLRISNTGSELCLACHTL